MPTAIRVAIELADGTTVSVVVPHGGRTSYPGVGRVFAAVIDPATGMDMVDDPLALDLRDELRPYADAVRAARAVGLDGDDERALVDAVLARI